MMAGQDLCGKPTQIDCTAVGNCGPSFGKVYHKPLFPETQEETGNFSEFFRYVQLLCLLHYVNCVNGRQGFFRQTHDIVPKWAAASKC